METIWDENQEITVKRKQEEPVWRLRQSEGVYWLSNVLLDKQKEVLHGFSTRIGGVSQDHLHSLNLSFARGDQESCVRENFRRMAAAVGFREEQMVFSHQTHTVNIRKVTKQDQGKGYILERDYSDVDGLITNEAGVVLTTFYADCVPVFLVDPEKKAIGLVHSGWRGTVGKIGEKAVERMREEYGCHPENLVAAIGPSICQSCYEVSEDVIQQFKESFSGHNQEELYQKKENGRYQLDLWRANELVLKDAGIPETQISVTDLCTCCNPRLLYSHRASQGKRGNLAAFLMLKEEE